jgi:hypothetical protein
VNEVFVSGEEGEKRKKIERLETLAYAALRQVWVKY